MGALMAAYSLFLVQYEPQGSVVFGCPRFGNAKLASDLMSALSVPDSLKTIGFAYLRDLVPHVPPRFLGFRSAQRELYYIVIEPQASGEEAMSSDYNLVDFLKYDKGYINSESSFAGDAEFAGATYTFSVADHIKYFNMALVPASCGLYSDDYSHN